MVLLDVYNLSRFYVSSDTKTIPRRCTITRLNYIITFSSVKKLDYVALLRFAH